MWPSHLFRAPRGSFDRALAWQLRALTLPHSLSPTFPVPTLRAPPSKLRPSNTFEGHFGFVVGDGTALYKLNNGNK